MGGIRQDKAKESPAIPTSALPDIIFILLFFFMVTTKPKESNKLVSSKLPDVSQIHLLDRKMEKAYIYIGFPKNKELYGEEERVQVNGRLVTPVEIPNFIKTTVEAISKPEKKHVSHLIVVFEIDEDVPYGTISDVEAQLRKVEALEITYINKKKKSQ